MSRRSPHNKRYQKDNTPKGQTRKSAASAKPARASSADSKPAKEKKNFKQRYAESTPQTAEYKKYRKQWWIALGVGAGVLTLSLLLSLEKIAEQVGRYGQMASLVLTFISLFAIGYAWYVDLKKIRPEMKKFAAQGAGKK